MIPRWFSYLRTSPPTSRPGGPWLEFLSSVRLLVQDAAGLHSYLRPGLGFFPGVDG